MSIQLVGNPTNVDGKIYYPAVQVNVDERNVVVNVGDPILVNSGDVNNPYLALLVELFRVEESGSFMTCRWFYRIHDVPAHIRRIKKIGKDEALLSNVEDTNPLQSLQGIANVELKGKEKSIPPRKHCNKGHDLLICKRIYFPRRVLVRAFKIAEVERELKILIDPNSEKNRIFTDQYATIAHKRNRLGKVAASKQQNSSPKRPRTASPTSSKKQKHPKKDKLIGTVSTSSANTSTGLQTTVGNTSNNNSMTSPKGSNVLDMRDHNSSAPDVLTNTMAEENKKRYVCFGNVYTVLSDSDDDQSDSQGNGCDSASAHRRISGSDQPVCFRQLENGEWREEVHVKVPLRRDIFIRNKDQGQVKMKMSHDREGNKLQKSRVGEQFQASIPACTGTTTNFLLNDCGCAWKPPYEESMGFRKEDVNRYLESVKQIIHFVYTGVRVGAYHPSMHRYYPGVIVAVRSPQFATKKQEVSYNQSYALIPGTVVDVLFDDSNVCTRYDARDVVMSSVHRSVTEEAALEVLMVQNYDVDNALKVILNVHSSYVSNRSPVPHIDGTSGALPTSMLKYKPAEATSSKVGQSDESSIDSEISESDTESVSTSGGRVDSSVAQKVENGTIHSLDKDAVGKQMILRALLALPPGWSTEEKHSFAIGINRYGKMFHRIHALMCHKLGWTLTASLTRRPLAQEKWRESKSRDTDSCWVVSPNDYLCEANEPKTVQDVVWFYYFMKYRRRFLEAPLFHHEYRYNRYHERLRCGYPSVVAYALSDIYKKDTKSQTEKKEIDVQPIKQNKDDGRKASTAGGVSGTNSAENRQIMASNNNKAVVNQKTSEIRVLMCTNPQCTSTRHAAITESQFRAHVSSLRTIGVPSWRQAANNSWWYCFDCCPCFPSRVEALIANIQLDKSGKTLMVRSKEQSKRQTWKFAHDSTHCSMSIRNGIQREPFSGSDNPLIDQCLRPPGNNNSETEFLRRAQVFFASIGKPHKYDRLLALVNELRDESLSKVTNQIYSVLRDAPEEMLKDLEKYLPKASKK